MTVTLLNQYPDIVFGPPLPSGGVGFRWLSMDYQPELPGRSDGRPDVVVQDVVLAEADAADIEDRESGDQTGAGLNRCAEPDMPAEMAAQTLYLTDRLPLAGRLMSFCARRALGRDGTWSW